MLTMSSRITRHKVGVGLLGSGVVGEAIQDLIFEGLQGHVGADLELEIRKIYTRNPSAKKWFAHRPELFTAQAMEVIDDSQVEIVIEALGLQDAADLPIFRDYILRAFEKGKSVVTSDKAVLARYGKEIWAAAQQSGRQLRFEACVGGGIPVIRSLTESFAVEEPEAVFGIVNGTCNYILSQMEKSGKPYAEALNEAQQKGYAETNPTADVSGSDAEAKLLLLTAVAFGLQLQPGTTWRKGIEDIHAVDFRYAGRTGSSTIKHLAVAKRSDSAVQVFVSPVLMPQDNLLAGIDGATNAICFKGRKSAGPRCDRDCDYVLVGPGAGGGPTAMAVLGDVCELARAKERRFAGLPSLVEPGILTAQPENDIDGSFYVRFIVKDRAGIVGDIGQTFGGLGVNISEIWQLRHSGEELQTLARSYHLKENPEDILPFVITLERATLRQVRDALDSMRNRDYILVDPVWFPIWSAR
ncbi:MAG: homoserine dehydrogenase [Deltaproteobacteria bacterium]|nr:homoserine dehydrogenase [Deltaproteobacteria bacterium]